VRAISISLLLFAAGCADIEETGQATESEEGPRVCEVVQSIAPLPPGIEESSGVLAGRRDPGVLWTHNDSGWPARLFAIRPGGEMVATIEIDGAENVDWEDISFGPCPAGDCIFIADIGDNNAAREFVSVYRLPEPDPRGARAGADARFDFVYPDGPRDAEGLFVLPSGEMYVVSKGTRDHAAALYRYPGELRTGPPVTLERVAALSPGPLELLDQLTAADASPSGRWVAIRSYQSIAFHHTPALVGGDTVPAARFELDEVDEVQGEGLAILDDGTVYLTGEAGFDDALGTVSILRCTLP
jgi:hypothetical protein